MFYFKKEDFTFLNAFIFLAPVLIDLYESKLVGKIINIIKWTLVCIDIAAVVVCLASLFEWINETETSVTVAVMFVEGQINISWIKILLFILMLANILVPVVLGLGNPSKKNLRSIRLAKMALDEEEKEKAKEKERVQK